MATEQELQDQITALKAELENTITERDLLTASNVDKDLARDVQLKAAEADAQAKIDDLQDQVDTLKKKKAAAAVTGDQVVLAGVPHDIVRQERAADLVSAHRARFVDDDDICLVVKKS